MIFIGITGGIGSGKSLACSLFAQKNVPIFYADEIAKNIIDTEIVISEVEAIFGKDILDTSGKPDRKKLAGVVFPDKNKLQKLNSIIHPKVFNQFDVWKSQQASSFNYGLTEAALIFESGMNERLDYTLSVITDKKKRIERVMKRDGSTEQEVKARMKHQLSDDELIKKSDFVLHNDKTKDELASQINFFHTLFSTLTLRKEIE